MKPQSPTRRTLFSRPSAAAVTVLSAIGLSACQISIAPQEVKPESSIHAAEDVAADAQQIRLLMRSLVDPFTGEVESAADRIIAGTDDIAVKRAALDWKAQAVPAFREALFQPEPLTALVDAWVLTCQMATYYSEGPGRTSLGASSGIAVAASMRLEQRMNDTAASLTYSGDVSRVRAYVREWAAAHPISTAIAHRENVLSRVLEKEQGLPLTAAETVSSMTMTVDDLSRRLEVYSDQLFRQARWEAEMLTLDLTDQLELGKAIPLAERAVDSLTTSMGALLPEAERLVKLAESAPHIIAEERAAAIDSVRQELGRTVTFLREERVAALEHITGERLAALESIHESIIQERKALTDDMRRISVEAIDHAFLRAGQLAAALAIVLLVAALLGLAMVRRMILDILRERRDPAA